MATLQNLRKATVTGPANSNGGYQKPGTGIPVTDLDSATQTKINSAVQTSSLGVASGVATLGSDGKIAAGQIPSSLVGSVNFQGVWNASTNTPTLTSSTGTKGFYYTVSVAGTTALNGIASWAVGDWAIFDGTTWQKVNAASSGVTSVNGKSGVVSLAPTDLVGYTPPPVTKVAGKTGDVTLVGADISDSGAVGRSVLQAGTQAAGQSALGLGNIATHSVSEFATAAQGALATTAYQKPGTGIPVTDLDSATQTKITNANVFTASGGLATTSVGGTTYAALPVDANGDVKANVVPRTGTVSDLLSIAGGAGEIASATDQYGVVLYRGVANQARYFGSTISVDVNSLSINYGTDQINYTVPRGVSSISFWFSGGQKNLDALKRIYLIFPSVNQIIEVELRVDVNIKDFSIATGAGDLGYNSGTNYCIFRLSSIFSPALIHASSTSGYGNSVVFGVQNTFDAVSANGEQVTVFGYGNAGSANSTIIGTNNTQTLLNSTITGTGGTITKFEKHQLSGYYTTAGTFKLTEDGTDTGRSVLVNTYSAARIKAFFVWTSNVNPDRIARLKREFDVFQLSTGGAEVRNIITPIADYATTGSLPSISSITIDTFAKLDVRVTQPESGTWQAMFEFIACM